MSIHISLPDEAATLALGARLAQGIAPGRVLHLRGELGAGKTTLARGLLRALGHAGRIKSPTYTLVEVYPLSRLNLYHFDLFRLKEPAEWLNSGFREYFNAESACVVEWPERAQGLLPPADLEVQLQFEDAKRRAAVQAHTAAGSSWLSLSSPPTSP